MHSCLQNAAVLRILAQYCRQLQNIADYDSVYIVRVAWPVLWIITYYAVCGLPRKIVYNGAVLRIIVHIAE
jgi:hypothetical protein